MRELAVCIVHLAVLMELLNRAQIEVHDMLNTHLGNTTQFDCKTWWGEKNTSFSSVDKIRLLYMVESLSLL
jgi:hypothetical protein